MLQPEQYPGKCCMFIDSGGNKRALVDRAVLSSASSWEFANNIFLMSPVKLLPCRRNTVMALLCSDVWLIRPHHRRIKLHHRLHYVSWRNVRLWKTENKYDSRNKEDDIPVGVMGFAHALRKMMWLSNKMLQCARSKGSTCFSDYFF